MAVASLSHPDLFIIVDETAQETHYGCDQKWFRTAWQRISGCGPSVASNLVFYMTRLASGICDNVGCASKERALDLMEDVWEYVTPIPQRGIPTTELFGDSLAAYLNSKGIAVHKHAVCDLSGDISTRPSLREVVAFLADALANDFPVAFLNLCNGEERNLDRWHWVTVVSLDDEANDRVFIDVLDEGVVKRIDLALWHRTTIEGGGFVYFALGEV